jgi:KUP system potassium uptake protein
MASRSPPPWWSTAFSVSSIWKLWKWKWWSRAADRPIGHRRRDLPGANLLKLLEGAWALLLFGSAMVILILTWQRIAHSREQDPPGRSADRSLIRSLEKKPPHIVPGTAAPHQRSGFRAGLAVAQSQAQQGAARAQYRADHRDRRYAAHRPDDRVEISPISDRFTRVELKPAYGGAECPESPRCRTQAGSSLRHHVDVVFPSRRSLKASAHSGMPAWQDRLFIGLARSANDATDYFQIPTGRVVEVGTQVAV